MKLPLLACFCLLNGLTYNIHKPRWQTDEQAL